MPPARRRPHPRGLHELRRLLPARGGEGAGLSDGPAEVFLNRQASLASLRLGGDVGMVGAELEDGAGDVLVGVASGAETLTGVDGLALGHEVRTARVRCRGCGCGRCSRCGGAVVAVATTVGSHEESNEQDRQDTHQEWSPHCAYRPFVLVLTQSLSMSTRRALRPRPSGPL